MRRLLGLGLVILILWVPSGASALTLGVPVYVVGGNPKGAPVVVVGDSITKLTAPHLENELKRFSYVITATPGITMSQSLPNIQRIVSTRPAQNWVVELGTNDTTNPELEQAFTSEVSALSSQRCVVLLTVNSHLRPNVLTFDQRMKSLAAT